MKRPGDWRALGYGDDPIDADAVALGETIAYYTKVAEAITEEAKILHRIAGGGDLVGKYADKISDDAGGVAASLDKVTGRYEAVVQALTAYEPALPPALQGSAKALADAEDAQSRLAAAQGQTATPGTGQTQAQANADPANPRNVAVRQAESDLEAARSAMRQVMAGLDAAGQAAARTIRAALNDGLKDTLGDKIAHFFLKLIAILVKIWTYIAMALSVIALIIPGLGEAIFALGAAAFVGQAVLTATGNGNGMDLLMAGVGMLSFGAGKAIESLAAKGLAGAAKPASELGEQIAAWDSVAGKASSGGALTEEEQIFNALPRPGVQIDGLDEGALAAAGKVGEESMPGSLAEAASSAWSKVTGQASANGFVEAMGVANTALKPLNIAPIAEIPALGILRGQGVFDSAQSWFGGIWGAVGDAGKLPPGYDAYKPETSGTLPELDDIQGTFSGPMA